jgi:hypothetical protein
MTERVIGKGGSATLKIFSISGVSAVQELFNLNYVQVP